jgi:hypothetical protein
MCLKSDNIRNSGDLQKSLLSRRRETLSVLAALMFVLASTGCVTSSISESSDSSSESSKSSSKSSKSSSDDKKESYIRDIKQYTVAYTRSNGDIKGFPKGLSTISEKHGVTDWEAYSATYLGIGEGFAKASVTQQQLDVYSSYLAAGDQLKVSAIKQGFSQGH